MQTQGDIESKKKELDQRIIDLVLLLNSIDINSPEATLNAMSISDNNGGRILL